LVFGHEDMVAGFPSTLAFLGTTIVLAVFLMYLSACEARTAAHIDWSRVDRSLLDEKFGGPERKLKRAANANTSRWEVIPGRSPKTKSLPDGLAQIPNTPEGRKFVEQLAQSIFARFGIWVPTFIIDLFFEDSSYFLNYLKFTGWELYDGIAALNLAYQMGWITSNTTKPDILPQDFDLGNYAKAPINVSKYLPGLPVELIPGVWKGFYRGNATQDRLRAEIFLPGVKSTCK